MERGSRRTRSQAAPDWTLQESLTLVNEIKAVEAEAGGTMSSFQKWQLTVEHCNALDVCRSMDQCKRKWESLLDDYRRVKPWEAKYWTASFGDSRRKELGLPEGFDLELFEAVDSYVKMQGMDVGGADTDPDQDSDPEAQPDDSLIFLERGSKKQRRRSNTRKRRAEESLQSWRYALSGSVKQEQPSLGEKVEPKIQHSAMEIEGEPSGLGDKEIEGEPSGLGDKVEEPPENKEGDNIMAEPSTGEDKEDKQEMMTSTLQKNAELINAVLEGNFAEDGDDDMVNSVPDPTDLARLQADKLIKYLGKISETLGELCEIVQELTDITTGIDSQFFGW